MGAVIGLLAYEDGKRLDQQGFRITANAVVSFIVTLAKSSFLLGITEAISQLRSLHFYDKSHKLSDLKIFDEASRGPLGSLKLVFARHKSKLLASCAAVIGLRLCLSTRSCNWSSLSRPGGRWNRWKRRLSRLRSSTTQTNIRSVSITEVTQVHIERPLRRISRRGRV